MWSHQKCGVVTLGKVPKNLRENADKLAKKIRASYDFALGSPTYLYIKRETTKKCIIKRIFYTLSFLTAKTKKRQFFLQCVL